MEEFWNKVAKSEGCWEWQGSRNGQRKGYGSFWYRGRHHRAHRFAWTLANGEIPPGLLVCHRCDNPPCVRPDHLFLGTNEDNMADMRAKGRARNGQKCGEMNSNAILTAAQVKELRQLRDAGYSFRSIAARMGLSKATVIAAARGETWASVDEVISGACQSSVSGKNLIPYASRLCLWCNSIHERYTKALYCSLRCRRHANYDRRRIKAATIAAEVPNG